MRAVGKAYRGVVAVSAFVALGVAGALATDVQASSQSITKVSMKPGDQLRVKGSPIVCAVQNNGGTLNIVCAIGSLSSPTLHSYGAGIADSGVRLAQVEPNGSKLVKSINEPRVSGATFAVRPGKAQAYTVAPPAAVLIGGTHIFCAVDTAAGLNITCGLSSLAAGLQYPVGSYIMSVSSRFALLGQAEPKAAFKTITFKSQP
jgi:hypothetical protein